jgi:outer membrane protein assembly factor BamB
MAEQKKRRVRSALWKTKLPGIKNAILPSNTTRSNPLVVGDLVFASVFAPGFVCAARRKTGELLWLNPLDSLGSGSVLLHGRNLYATSNRTLYALNPKTGQVRWEFSPISDPGEWLYSSPTARAGRVFIGDRCGHLHCLDAKTGGRLWRRMTSKGRNNQTNSTALVTADLVIAANNQGMVVCYSSKTGKTIWRQKVDGACIGELLRLKSRVIVAANSLYAIDQKTGRICDKWNFPLKTIRSVAVVRSRIAAILGADFGMLPSAWNDPSAFNGELVILERGQETARRKLNGTPCLRANAEDGWLYTVTHSEMNAFDPFDASVLAARRGEIAQPAVLERRLYGLTRDGVLFAESTSNA